MLHRLLRTLIAVTQLDTQPDTRPCSKVVLREIIEGEVSDLLFQIIASPSSMLLMVIDLSGRADTNSKGPQQLTIRFDAPVTLTVGGAPAGWPLWEGLPQVTWAKGNPFADATRWAHAHLFHENVCTGEHNRKLIMQNVYRICREAAALAARRCDKAARKACMRFNPHLRWWVYQWLVADESGRLTQLAAVCPGALIFAYALKENQVERDDYCAAAKLLEDARAGLPLKKLLNRAVADWHAHVSTRCVADYSLDLVWRAVRDSELPTGVCRMQRLLIQRASSTCATTLLWLPPPVPFVPSDIPKPVRANAAWLRATKRWLALMVTEDRLRAEALRQIGDFVSAHATFLQRAARARRKSIPCLLQEIADTAAATGNVPHRSSNPDRFLGEVDDFHRDSILRKLGVDPDVLLPEPPCLEFHDAELSVVAIRTPAELIATGNELRNCMASYLPYLLAGTSFLYRASHKNRPLALDLKVSRGKWRIAQAAGPGNAGLPAEVWVALERWASSLAPPPRAPKPEMLVAPQRAAACAEDDIPF